MLEKIAKQLVDVQAAIHRQVIPLTTFKFHDGQCPGAGAAAFDDSAWPNFEVGNFWGGYDSYVWFRARVPIAERLRGHKLALRFLLGPRDSGQSTAETLLYVNGRALQAIDVWHETAWLPPEEFAHGEVAVALHAWSGVYGPPPRRQFKLAELVRVDEATDKFYHLALTLHKAVQVLDPNDLRREQILQALNGAFHLLDFTVPKSDAFYASAAEALAFLSEAVGRWAAVNEIKPAITAVGHAHIDLAWLWRARHAREKGVRTFTTALHLMRQYPEYRFMHSAPAAYKNLEADDPALFARVKEKIASGEWEITGGMWVESDTNLPNGESLVRQFLLGRRYIREQFGQETTVLWLPDVFGYSAALPQIAAKSGIRTFMTTKISWSQINRFPYDTFRWRGLDGTELLTHFVTTPDGANWFYTYNGQAEPRDLKGLWDQYRQKDVNDELLHLFGWGDGGGGPTQEMIESALALKNLPGMPRVEMGRSEPYFQRLHERVANQDLPVWDGELYLEYHRGTYTSQAYNKRANRKAEILYHQAEWLSSLAAVLGASDDFAYPAESLRSGWERLLFNQFHDILPGSSIHDVYVDCREEYALINEVGETAVRQALAALLPEIKTEAPSLVVFNPTYLYNGGLVSVPWSADLEDQVIHSPGYPPGSSQVVENSGERQIIFDIPTIPPLGFRALPLVPISGDLSNNLSVTPTRLENQFLTVTLNECGQLASVFDKRNAREVLAPGARGNVFQAFEDKPMNFDAWDIDLYYLEKMREVDDLLDAVVEETGPLRGVLRLRWRFHDSTITQRLTIYRDTPRLDFRTEVDWHQSQVLLKVAFPVNIRATRATYDIQFGSLERATHWNTSWDYARFEVVAHKWVDLSEGNYGVALLNDCKYGHDVHDNVMRLTLIKSAIDPDPTADQGQHEFVYSLWPHEGDWRTGGVVEQGYALNYPLLGARVPSQPDGRLPAAYSFAATDCDHVVVDTIKQAEEDAAWVVRVYECKQYRAEAVHLSLGQPIARAVETNLVEEDEQPVAHSGRRLTFSIQPFEIKTFKVWFEND